MSGDCDLLNDMSDIHDEQPEELRGEHPSEVQDDEQGESLHKTIEELTDGMKITNDNPITYGEYRAAENDPNHPLHDPDNPVHEQGPGPRKVDTPGVSYATWVSVGELSASKSSEG